MIDDDEFDGVTHWEHIDIGSIWLRGAVYWVCTKSQPNYQEWTPILMKNTTDRLPELWISVKDKLPMEGKWVKVRFKIGSDLVVDWIKFPADYRCYLDAEWEDSERF